MKTAIENVKVNDVIASNTLRMRNEELITWIDLFKVIDVIITGDYVTVKGDGIKIVSRKGESVYKISK